MRRRLVLVALATTSMVALAFLLPLAVLVRRVADDRAVTAAERQARSVVPVLALGASDESLQALAGEGPFPMTIYLADGRTIGPGGDHDASVALARAQRVAFQVRRGSGGLVVTPVVRTVDDVPVTDVVVVELPSGSRTAGVTRSWLALGAVAVTLVAVAVFVADRLASSIVEPVEALVDTTQRLGLGDASARVVPAGPPEIVGVGRAVNDLASRIEGLLSAERELVADLSHRLRTPLTALRLDAESLAGTDVGDRVLADVTALQDAVDGVIAEARSPRRVDPVGTDLVGVAAERAAFWAVLAEDQGRPWSVDLPRTVIPVRVARAELEAALDALIGNVFEHTPEGVGAHLAVAMQDGKVELVLDDDGPGFPSTDVVQRGVSTRSTGLGLDIARRTAAAAGGALVLGTSPGGGAQVRIVLPARV